MIFFFRIRSIAMGSQCVSSIKYFYEQIFSLTICFSELYPAWARSVGNSISSFAQWIANIIISISFLSLARAITREGTYFLFAGITFFGVLWFYLVMPETKGKDIEEIQFSLKGSWFNRGRVRPNIQSVSVVFMYVSVL